MQRKPLGLTVGKYTTIILIDNRLITFLIIFE